ncbi:MAG: hypothetical protein AB7K24_08445 [Gemmataceae bacterium]
MNDWDEWARQQAAKLQYMSPEYIEYQCEHPQLDADERRLIARQAVREAACVEIGASTMIARTLRRPDKSSLKYTAMVTRKGSVGFSVRITDGWPPNWPEE